MILTKGWRGSGESKFACFQSSDAFATENAAAHSSWGVLGESPDKLLINAGGTVSADFIQDYGVLETITKVEPANNACSKAKSTSTVRRKPEASPLLFGEFLMQLCAFVFLEDISGELPSYEETYLSVPMDAPMREAYRELEDDMRKALKAHRGNRSVLSTMLNTLLLFPDHPYGMGTLYGTEFDQELKRKGPIRDCRTP